MKDEEKSKEHLIHELMELRLRLDDFLAQLEGERKKVRELAVLHDSSSIFFKEIDEESITEIIVDTSRHLVRSEYAALLLLRDGRVTRFHTSIGDSSTCKLRPAGILQRVLRDSAPLRGRDIRTLPGFKGLPDGHPAAIKSVLVVPVIFGDSVLGEIILANRVGMDEFSSGDEDLLLTFAFHAALALERARQHREIEKLATTDGLTGLNNHRTFQERLDIEIERARRLGEHLSILMMDIDFFKKLNDDYGHRAGDEVLKTIACRIIEGVRNIDLAARYGGEEFVAILPATSLQGALVTAERIRHEIMNCSVRTTEHDISVTISIGIATFPEDASQREDLIEKADQALYGAKRAGRNKVLSFRDVPGEYPGYGRP